MGNATAKPSPRAAIGALGVAAMVVAIVVYMGNDRIHSPDVWITAAIFEGLFAALAYRIGIRLAARTSRPRGEDKKGSQLKAIFAQTP